MHLLLFVQANLSFPEARDRLIARIKDDNTFVTNTDKRIKEIRRNIDNYEKKLRELQQE
jgi:intraflagellar transport protein 74